LKKLNYFQNKPKALKIDVNGYLSRLGLERQEPSLKYLKALQKAHLLHIPFENLDIHYGRKIILDYSKIYDKVVKRKRGGFCYELNGIFYHLLYHLGFDCHIISAEVMNSEAGEFGKPFDHMAIIVSLANQNWLCDVGFGDGIINPIKVVVNEPQIDYTKYWKIETDADERLILKESSDTSTYKSTLRFTLEEKQLIQFMEMCEYHQNSPESTFTNKKLVTKLLPNGRVTLTGRKLKIHDLGESKEIELMNEDEFLSKLQHHFGISFKDLIPEKD